MPGFRSTSDFDERRNLKVDCDKVIFVIEARKNIHTLYDNFYKC